MDMRLMLHTFANALLSADLSTILHGMETEVYLRGRTLVTNCPHGLVGVVTMIHALLVLHDGEIEERM